MVQQRTNKDDSEIYDSFLALFDNLPVENETSGLVLFLNGLILAFSCFDVSKGK